MSPDPTNAGVSFSNDVESAVPTGRAARNAQPMSQSLTKSGKAWDIDGDGVLDEAELALKNMDAVDGSVDGTLSKAQMYQLMNTNIKMDKELTKIKKVVYALVGFTVLLALANVGVSFAAAYLAKDTKSADGALVDAATGRTLKTDATAAVFEADPAIARRRRKLCETTTVEGKGNSVVSSSTCDVSDFTSLSVAAGAALVEACDSGGNAVVRKLFKAGNVDFPLCAVTDGTLSITGNGKQAKGMTISKANGSTISVTPDDAAVATSYSVTGLYSPLNGLCDVDSDCATNHVCESGTCKANHGAKCAAASDCKANSDCGFGNLFPTPEFGTCVCASNAGCGDGEVCASECMVADVLPQCRTQAALDATCFGPGETCTVYSPTYTMCEATTEPTYVILPVDPVTEPAPVAKPAPVVDKEATTEPTFSILPVVEEEPEIAVFPEAPGEVRN